VNKPQIDHSKHSARYVYDPKHKWRLLVPQHLINIYRGKQPEAICYVEFKTRIRWNHKFNAAEFHNILGISRQKCLVMLKSLARKGLMIDLGNKRRNLTPDGRLYDLVHEFQADLKAIRATFYKNNGFPTNQNIEVITNTVENRPPTFYKEPRVKVEYPPEIEKARQALIKGDRSLWEAMCRQRERISAEVWNKNVEDAKAVILANKNDPTFNRDELCKYYGEKVKRELKERGYYIPDKPMEDRLLTCPIRT